MANSYNYSNTAIQTTLTGSISSGATSLVVGATTGFPPAFPYILALDYGAAGEELVSVTAAAGTTLTATRGFSGTSAQSHSLGAVVRHVVNAQDLTDFRTHEAATGDVHGVTGALVGATQTQTLTNKTLTSPTVNGGALSGTFTGTPAFSGGLSTTAQLTATGATAGQDVFRGLVSGDAQNRFTVDADGRMEWGSGSAAREVALYRSAADTLTTDDIFVVGGELWPSSLVRASRGNATDSQYETRATGDANARWFMQANGAQFWGSGAAGVDTNLYRSAANVLTTDDSFEVGGNLTVTGTADAATTTTATGVTGATGWNPTIQALRVTSGVSTVNITLNRTGPLLTTDDLGGTSGNISPDILVCTVPAAFRPPADFYVSASTGIGHGTLRVQTADGQCQLLTWIPNIGITNDSNLRFTYTFSS